LSNFNYMFTLFFELGSSRISVCAKMNIRIENLKSKSVYELAGVCLKWILQFFMNLRTGDNSQ